MRYTISMNGRELYTISGWADGPVRTDAITAAVIQLLAAEVGLPTIGDDDPCYVLNRNAGWVEVPRRLPDAADNIRMACDYGKTIKLPGPDGEAFLTISY